MFSALDSLATVIGSNATSWWPASAANPVPTPPKNALFTPEEPTTLALALVGIGIIGAYVGIQRLLRPRRESAKTSASASAARTTIERPTRGAA